MIPITTAIFIVFFAAAIGFLLCAMLTTAKTSDLEAENIRLRVGMDHVAVELHTRAMKERSPQRAVAYGEAAEMIREVLREGLE